MTPAHPNSNPNKAWLRNRRLAEQLAIRAELGADRSAVADPLPAFRFFEPAHDEHGHQGGDGADRNMIRQGERKHGPPRTPA